MSHESQQIRDKGFVIFDREQPNPEINKLVHDAGWAQFARSWDGMPRDSYMADGGRYRRRRHGVFEVSHDRISRASHQPHFQTTEYNRLNGGVERWFEPLTDYIADGPVLQSILGYCHRVFSPLAPHVTRWHTEVHQFRIEAMGNTVGNPTPEGMHRDGVDYVLVLLISRHNIESGVTRLADLEKRPLGEFTLISPGDCVLLDDHRVYHGVTPVTASDTTREAYRDVMVVTFKAH